VYNKENEPNDAVRQATPQTAKGYSEGGFDSDRNGVISLASDSYLNVHEAVVTMLPSEDLTEVTWNLMNYEDQSSNNIPDSKLDAQTEIKIMNRPSALYAIHRIIEAESHSVITALPFRALEGDPWQYQIPTASDTQRLLLPVPLLEVNDLRSSPVLNESSFIRVSDPPVSITRDSDWMIFSKDLVAETATRSYS
jgi:hypothetical protein